MTRHHGNQANRMFEQKSANMLIILFVLVAMCAFILLYAPARSFATQVLYSVSLSVWGVRDTGSNMLKTFALNFNDKKTLAHENEILRAEITHMQAQVLDRNLLAEKVLKLEEALGRAGVDNRIVAYVVVGPGLSPYDTLIVDAGEDNGVAVGDMVVYANAGIIGEIIEVSRTSSKVKLYSSSGEESQVKIGKKYISVVAVGKGMGNFEAKVPQGSAVVAGDDVTSLSGELLFGKVYVVQKDDTLPFTRVLFRLPFNIAEIQSVEIIKANR